MCNCVWVINWCKFGHKLAKTLQITSENLATNFKTLGDHLNPFQWSQGQHLEFEYFIFFDESVTLSEPRNYILI